MMNFIESKYGEDPHRQRQREMMKKYGSEINLLEGPNRWSALFLVAIVFLQFLVSISLRESGWFLIVVTSYVIGAFFNHALFVLMHEATHNLIFKKTLFNRAIAILGDLAIILPVSMAFRRYHLLHHRHMGVYELDADICSKVEGKLVGQNRLRKLIWLLFFGFAQIFRPLRMQGSLRQPDKWTFLNGIICLSFAWIWFSSFGLNALGYLFLSSFFAIGLHPLGGRWIAEHYTANSDQETFSYYGPINTIMFNIGHHTEHHDFANIAWNKLPELRNLASEFYNNRIYHTSYSKVLLSFIFSKEAHPFFRVIRSVRTN